MGTILLFALLVGLDNLQLSTALGMLGIPARNKWLLIGAFVLFEMTMPLLGLSIGQYLEGHFGEAMEYVGPAILFVTGCLVLVMATKEWDAERLTRNPLLLLSLPVLMSLDNLAAGVGLAALGYPVLLSALAVGLVSGSMALLGVLLGERLRLWLPGSATYLSGAFMIGLSLFFILMD